MTPKFRIQKPIEDWFRSQGWQPAPFQKDCWRQIFGSTNGLLSASTGSGKTYAVWLGFVNRWLSQADGLQREGLRLLWITPLRALGQEIQKALQMPLMDLKLDWNVGLRTGDSNAAEKRMLFVHPPKVLVTTPESLHVILSRRGYAELLASLDGVVVDEWHELQGTKRGVMVQLALAWIQKTCAPQAMIWGISATFGDVEGAARSLFGGRALEAVHVQGPSHKPLHIHPVVPDHIDDLPQSGHIGLKLLEKTLPVIEQPGSTLIFTNTRSQSEIWYQRYLEVCPDLAGRLALHHGSLEGDIRRWVENRLKDGRLKAVVCTSSLDLGVDFLPVERVIQVGSPKSVARFIQRAGRSGHAPGRPAHIWFVPTHSMELVEAAALRLAVHRNIVEPRPAASACFDVLMQFMTTLAISDGFDAEILFQALRKTESFEGLSRSDFQRILGFAAMGGKALAAYTDYRRLENDSGTYRAKDKRLALRHRLNIGVIPSDAMMWVKLKNGKRLGQIEEWFVGRLQVGNVFWFAGQALRLVRIREGEVHTEPASGDQAIVPSWMGGRLPLSSHLAQLILEMFRRARTSDFSEPELESLKPLLAIQAELSALPENGTYLIEQFSTRLGHHLLIYPFEGRVAHEAIGAILALRIGRLMPVKLSIAMNDYGLEICSDKWLPLEELCQAGLFSTSGLREHLLQSVNAVELARRRFRDIARIAGLVFSGYPGREKKSRHLQASSGLIFDVLSEHDPQNLLLRQAFDEALTGIEEARIYRFFHAIRTLKRVHKNTERPTPLSIPIITDRLRNSLSTLSFEEELIELLK